jgi:hypothetical protein
LSLKKEKNITNLSNFDTPGVRSSTKIRDSSPAANDDADFCKHSHDSHFKNGPNLFHISHLTILLRFYKTFKRYHVKTADKSVFLFS